MKHTRPFQVVVAGAAACAALLASPAAQGANDDSAGSSVKAPQPPTFAEFEAATYRDHDGQYIVNGDEPLATTAELRAYYDRMVSSGDTDSQSLIVNQDGGVDDVWSASQALDLTYCVSDDFGAEKDTVVDAMAAGAGQWEAASSGVDFTYVPSEDADCVTSNDNVLFSVEPVVTSEYIARAFFPSSPDSERNVLVADSLTTSGWAPENILAHELGHVLGFRHEHTRPEAGTCFEDNNWRPLTPYDAASIMHYPQCNGATEDLSMSGTDREGVASIYG
ncbi:M57 family metalloprotease [Nocardioides plantarum]|uniref:M57 family metalloprotease n=1 Tax=Nocardioides plantarum TaxID=29299 RepID=A0ABV5KA24_9ACTN|nr:M57 family metalloprotease [Nocardioides plantarum]